MYIVVRYIGVLLDNKNSFSRKRLCLKLSVSAVVIEPIVAVEELTSWEA